MALTRESAKLAAALPSSPRVIPELHMEPSTSMNEGVVVSPSLDDVVLSHLPPVVLADRPIEFEFTLAGLLSDAHALAQFARYISTHANLSVAVAPEVTGQTCSRISAPVSVCQSGERRVARALIRPSAWSSATALTVESLTLAGRHLPQVCLPATLRVGFNNAPAPGGEVLAAAKAGDLAWLQAALAAGGSTEEADAPVRGECVLTEVSGECLSRWGCFLF